MSCSAAGYPSGIWDKSWTPFAENPLLPKNAPKFINFNATFRQIVLEIYTPFIPWLERPGSFANLPGFDRWAVEGSGGQAPPLGTTRRGWRRRRGCQWRSGRRRRRWWSCVQPASPEGRRSPSESPCQIGLIFNFWCDKGTCGTSLCKDTILKIRNKYSQKKDCAASVPQRKSHLCIPRKLIAQPQSQFPHSCVCERFICSQDRSAFSATGKYVDRFWEYINRSQTHECGNWDWGRAIVFSGNT